jgi:hypothetical protein
MKKFLFGLSVSLLSLSPIMAAPVLANTLFTDDFHRADSSDVGNGWITKSAASGCSNGISANRYYNIGSDSCGVGIYRDDIPPTSGTSIIVIFGAEKMGNRFGNFAGTLADDVMLGSGIRGYGVNCDGHNNVCKIYDNAFEKASQPFTFNNTDKFAMQIDISVSPQNWMDVYVWNATTSHGTMMAQITPPSRQALDMLGILALTQVAILRIFTFTKSIA